MYLRHLWKTDGVSFFNFFILLKVVESQISHLHLITTNERMKSWNHVAKKGKPTHLKDIHGPRGTYQGEKDAQNTVFTLTKNTCSDFPFLTGPKGVEQYTVVKISERAFWSGMTLFVIFPGLKVMTTQRSKGQRKKKPDTQRPSHGYTWGSRPIVAAHPLDQFWTLFVPCFFIFVKREEKKREKELPREKEHKKYTKI